MIPNNLNSSDKELLSGWNVKERKVWRLYYTSKGKLQKLQDPVQNREVSLPSHRSPAPIHSSGWPEGIASSASGCFLGLDQGRWEDEHLSPGQDSLHFAMSQDTVHVPNSNFLSPLPRPPLRVKSAVVVGTGRWWWAKVSSQSLKEAVGHGLFGAWSSRLWCVCLCPRDLMKCKFKGKIIKNFKSVDYFEGRPCVTILVTGLWSWP